MNKAYLHLGSNLGESQKTLRYAIYKIEEMVGVVTEQSSFWSTEAWGATDQPDFINMAIAVDTLLSPSELLDKIHDIEERLGRVRIEKWGARTVDIDIIFYNDLILETEKLIIPHKFMAERNFVLYPLSEIYGDFVHPILNKSVAQLKEECQDEGKISLIK